MGKYEKKKEKKHHKGLATVVLLILIAVVLALFVMPRILYEMDGKAEIGDDYNVSVKGDSTSEGTLPVEADKQENTEASSDMTNQALLEFPLLLDNGNLKIESIFQFDGINPDFNNQEGKNIATVTITNLSDTYLESAELSVTTDSGDVLSFVIADLPAGETALAFSIENASVNKTTTYTDIACKSVFITDASMNEDKITVSVEGTKVTLKNNTNEDIANVIIYCHASLGDQFFGGIAYTYIVNNLPANETAEVDAVECFLGLTEVVRIAINGT